MKKEYYMVTIQKESIAVHGIYGSPCLCIESTKKLKNTTDSEHDLKVTPN